MTLRRHAAAGFARLGVASALVLAACSGRATDPVVTDGVVTIEGTVVDQSDMVGIPGATVGTSLDSSTATTDESGWFELITDVPITDGSGSMQYAIEISATGYRVFRQTRVWGDHPIDQLFSLEPL